MNYQVRFTPHARRDLLRLFRFLAAEDAQAAREARAAIGKSMEILALFPFTCRKVEPDKPFLRELIIPFGRSGYVALFEIEAEQVVTVLALRHQREEDYF